MRNILGFATALAFALLVGGLIRAAALSGQSEPEHQPQEDHSRHQSANLQDNPGEASKPTPEDKEPQKQDPKPEPKPEPVLDLKNAGDPVSGKAVGEAPVVLEHKGWNIRFESEANRDKFLKKPVRYYASLSLEPGTGDKLLKVDASTYEKAAPATCGIMGGDIDPDGDVFVLHRGFKVYFCCWGGCGDEFVANPSKYYDHYGLVEKDGKLSRKQE